MTGEEFLQSKDIWNHPTLTDRNNKECYDVAELLEEYATGEPKRKPLSDGTLELTDEELDEINNLMKGKKAWNPHDGEISGGHKIIKMRLNIDDYIFCKYSGYDDEFASERKVVDIKAIAYLLERFNLTEK